MTINMNSRKALTILTVIFCSIISTSIQAQEQPTPVKKKVMTYPQALELYKQKKYQASYQAFLQLVSTDYGNVNYNYYLGRSAFFIKDYHEAIGAYERILISYPHNQRAKLELGRMYYELGDFVQSKRYLMEVLDSNAPETVKNNIRVYLARMSAIDNKPHNSVRATLLGSVFYDSNLNYSPQSDNFQLPSGTLNFPSDIGAWGSEQMLTVNHRYDNPKKYGFAFKNDMTLYNRWLPNQTDYNILFGSYTPALSWHKKGWTTDAALYVDDMTYGKNPYLMSYGIAPTVSYMPDLTQFVSTQFKLLKKDYQSNVYRDRDSQYMQFAMLYQKRMGALWTWYGQGMVESEQKQRSSNTVNVDYQSLTARLGMNYLFPKGYSAGVLGEYQQKQYLQDDFWLKSLSGANKRQTDTKLTVTATVTKDIQKTLSAQLKLSLVQNNSTIKIYEYQKNVVTLNLIKRF